MKPLGNLMRAFIWIGLTVITFGGCESPKHRMVHKKPEIKIACQQCYDEVSTVRRTPHRSNKPWNVIIRRHNCLGCKSEMSLYREEGVLKVKCERCAPEGLACDLCLPPDAPMN